jgi:hypothetical protein
VRVTTKFRTTVAPCMTLTLTVVLSPRLLPAVPEIVGVPTV